MCVRVCDGVCVCVCVCGRAHVCVCERERERERERYLFPRISLIFLPYNEDTSNSFTYPEKSSMLPCYNCFRIDHGHIKIVLILEKKNPIHSV